MKNYLLIPYYLTQWFCYLALFNIFFFIKKLPIVCTNFFLKKKFIAQNKNDFSFLKKNKKFNIPISYITKKQIKKPLRTDFFNRNLTPFLRIFFIFAKQLFSSQVALNLNKYFLGLPKLKIKKFNKLRPFYQDIFKIINFNFKKLKKNLPIFFFLKKFSFSFFEINNSISLTSQKLDYFFLHYLQIPQLDLQNYFLQKLKFINFSELSDPFKRLKPFFTKKIKTNFFLFKKFKLKKKTTTSFFFNLQRFFNSDINIFKKSTPSFILRSKCNTNFLLKINGFLYLTKLNFKLNYTSQAWSNFRKKIYQFDTRHELGRKIFSDLLQFYYVKTFFSPQMEFLKTSTIDTEIALTKPPRPPLLFNLFNKHFLAIQNKFYFYFLQNFDFNFYTKIKNEQQFMMKRIRFKPGYIILWKNYRKLYKAIFRKKFHYEYRLTRYLIRFNYIYKIQNFIFFEMQLLNLLDKLKIFPLISQTTNFIKNGFFWINGFQIRNPYYQIFMLDFIQIIISYNFFYTYKYLLIMYFKKYFFLKKLVHKKLKYSKFNFKINHFNNFFKKIINERNILLRDVPKYVELDFFSLSFFILYNPIFLNDYNFVNFVSLKYPSQRLYNWKYII